MVLACFDYVPVVELPEIGKRQQGYLTLTNFRLRFHRQQIKDKEVSKCDVSESTRKLVLRFSHQIE